jgi:ATP-binding cassette subfamily A (ABC1) protein 3
MASSLRPQWRRIYLQTLALVHKNLLVFFKAPLQTIVRALIFPIIVTIIFCELKHLDEVSTSSSTELVGISTTAYPVRDLADAILATPSQQKLVFVLNGISNDTLGPIIDGILHQPGTADLNAIVTDNAMDLFGLCNESLFGKSNCFAAVIFTSFNSTNVEYIIALDENLVAGFSAGDYRLDDSLLSTRLLPLQWAIDSSIGNFSTAPKPFTQPWTGSFLPDSFQQQASAVSPSFGAYVRFCSLPNQHEPVLFKCILKTLTSSQH